MTRTRLTIDRNVVKFKDLEAGRNAAVGVTFGPKAAQKPSGNSAMSNLDDLMKLHDAAQMWRSGYGTRPPIVAIPSVELNRCAVVYPAWVVVFPSSFSPKFDHRYRFLAPGQSHTSFVSS
jgi:hypothetical protein